ncbi:MAG: hypothetical protein M3P49_08620 [Actinomycetota bacterium]|nr:hypothetical protein [Actinomycetota bacterium]
MRRRSPEQEEREHGEDGRIDAVYYEGDHHEAQGVLVVAARCPEERTTHAFVLRRPLHDRG